MKSSLIPVWLAILNRSPILLNTGQILALTYPLIGNYGVSERSEIKGVEQVFESSRVHIQALVLADYSFQYHHWESVQTLDVLLREESVPGIWGVDTRKLTKRLREQGSMLGKVLPENEML